MHTRASNSELVEPLPEPERTLNRRLCQQNRRVPFERRNKRPKRIAADRVVALTLGSAITIPETANEFAIKGSGNSDNDKIMARIDAMTTKMDARYKELQSRSKPNPDHNDDDILMSRKEEAKFMQTFHRTHFYNDYRDSNRDNWRSSGRNNYNRDNYQSHSEDKPDLQKQLSDFIKAQHSTNSLLADKQSSRHSGSFPSNTQPNPKSDDEDEEPTPQPKPKEPKPVPRVDVLAGMPNYGKFFKELVSNKYKIEQISTAFLSDESSAILQNKVPPKLRDPGSFLIPCNFNKAFSCNALADLGASINLMPYSLYAKLVEVGKFTFLADFVIPKMEEDKGTILEEKIFVEFDEFMAMTSDENSESESDTEEPSFEKITFNTDYKIKTSLQEPPTNLELKPLLDNLEYSFLEEPSFLLMIISY
ncbi:hypothetical protein Tco_1175763 [Tanacetum coccineum]